MDGEAHDRRRDGRRREWWARILGVVAALGAMATAFTVTGWPAPGISLALGLGVYWLARGARR